MCRNIRVLHNFDPPTTPAEVRAAAVQYVRKVAGITRATTLEDPEVARAVEDIAAATARLLATLPKRGGLRTREGEREKARARYRRSTAT